MKNNLIRNYELVFWKKVTYREVFGGSFSEAPAVDGWCPHARIAEIPDLEGCSLPKRKAKFYRHKKIGHCIERDCVVLVLEGWEKQNEPQKYAETELEDLRANISPHYFKDARTIISNIQIRVGKFKPDRRSGGKLVFPKEQPRESFEYCKRKFWIKVYDLYRNGITRQERGDFLWDSDGAISGIWDVVTTIEERATISKQKFNEHMAVVKSPGGVREFLGSLKGKGIESTNETSQQDHGKDAEFFKNYYHDHIVKLPLRSALERFVKDVYISRAREFEKQKYFILCRNDRCNRLAKYFRRKKYCSVELDGRNCRQLFWKRGQYKHVRK